MKKAEQYFQNEHIRNAPILLNWNYIRNAYINKLWASLKTTTA